MSLTSHEPRFFFSLGANGREQHSDPASVERPSLRPLRLSDRNCAAVSALPDVRNDGLEADHGRALPGSATGADVTIHRRLRHCLALVAGHRRWVAGVAFGAVTLLACILLGRRLTGSSWPLAHARMLLVAAAAVCYFVSLSHVQAAPPVRATTPARRAAWLRKQSRAASCVPAGLSDQDRNAAPAGGIRISLEAIALSIISSASSMGGDAAPRSPRPPPPVRSTRPLLVVVASGPVAASLPMSARLVRLPLDAAAMPGHRRRPRSAHIAPPGAEREHRRSLLAC